MSFKTKVGDLQKTSNSAVHLICVAKGFGVWDFQCVFFRLFLIHTEK